MSGLDGVSPVNDESRVGFDARQGEFFRLLGADWRFFGLSYFLADLAKLANLEGQTDAVCAKFAGMERSNLNGWWSIVDPAPRCTARDWWLVAGTKSGRIAGIGMAACCSVQGAGRWQGSLKF
ncbi:MAG: hypothetical protein JWR69_2938 [Pedosphaera sp.]|nr:hypothetical protein [Pedosphaera sp.]